MSLDADILSSAAALAAANTPFVLLTVTATKGSTPRDAGARMIWQPGSGFIGTVGGGNFERLALVAAERVYRERTRVNERFVLGVETEQCCGGVIDVFLEYIGPTSRIVIFGAGHVAHAIAEVMRAAPMELVIADDRPEWNSADRFPHCRRITDYAKAVDVSCESPATTLVCVMTCSHDTDYELLRSVLSRANPPSFVGLIGSRSKRACLFHRLVDAGIDKSRVDAVHCPIGLGDMGKEPPMIAVSIAGQLLLECKKHAAR